MSLFSLKEKIASEILRVRPRETVYDQGFSDGYKRAMLECLHWVNQEIKEEKE